MNRRQFINWMNLGAVITSIVGCDQTSSSSSEASINTTTNSETSINSTTTEITPEMFRAVGDGSSDDSGALENADNSGLPILLSQDYHIASNITLSSPLVFRGGKLSPDSGINVTINSPIHADREHIFAGNGTFSGNPDNDWFYIEWFGAVNGTSADNSTAIQAAIDFVQNNDRRGGVISGAAQSYRCDNGLWVKREKPVVIRGEGSLRRELSRPDGNKHNFVLDFSNANEGIVGLKILNSATADHIRTTGTMVENLLIYRDSPETKGSGGIGLQVAGVHNGVFKQVGVHNFDTGMDVDETSDALRTFDTSFYHCKVEGATTRHIRVGDAPEAHFYSCHFGGEIGGQDTVLLIETGRAGSVPDAIHFDKCKFIEEHTQGTSRPNHCAVIKDGFWMSFSNCVFEQAQDAIIYIDKPDIQPERVDLIVSGCWTSAPQGRCVYSNNANVHFINTRLHAVNDSVECALFTASTQNPQNSKVISCGVDYAGVTGISINNANGFTATGNTFYGLNSNAPAMTIDNSADCSICGNSLLFTTGIVDNGVNNDIVGNGQSATNVLHSALMVNNSIEVGEVDNEIRFTDSVSNNRTRFQAQGDDKFILYASDGSGGSNVVFKTDINTSTPSIRIGETDHRWESIPGSQVAKQYISGSESLRILKERIAIPDGTSAPAAISGMAQLFVDSADGDLKVIFGDGTIKTITTDT